MENGFVEVYPFATENVNGYFERLNMKDKTVLTVGSSLDQAFNAMVLGAKKVTVFDISPNVYEFFKVKKDIILTRDRMDLYKILTDKKGMKNSYGITTTKDILLEKQVNFINNYLENDEKYELLRNKLKDSDIEFITGDIFKIGDSLKNNKYDRIIFSNILQYLEYYFKEENPLEVIKKCFPEWINHLNNDGILQLLYLYSYSYDDIFKNHSIATYNLRKINEILKGYQLNIEWIDGVVENLEDAIVSYQKRN